MIREGRERKVSGEEKGEMKMEGLRTGKTLNRSKK